MALQMSALLRQTPAAQERLCDTMTKHKTTVYGSSPGLVWSLLRAPSLPLARSVYVHSSPLHMSVMEEPVCGGCPAPAQGCRTSVELAARGRSPGRGCGDTGG